jgi:hypothetical protein
MLIDLREDLLKGDFSENLCLLQSYPQSSSCENLLCVANRLRTEDIVLSKFKYQQELEPEPTTTDRVLSAVFEWSSSARRSFLRSTEQIRTIIFDETPDTSSRGSPNTTVGGMSPSTMSQSERTKAATGIAPYSLAEGVLIFTDDSAESSSSSSSSSISILSTEGQRMDRDKVLVEEAGIFNADCISTVIDGDDAMAQGDCRTKEGEQVYWGTDGSVDHSDNVEVQYDEPDVVESL